MKGGETGEKTRRGKQVGRKTGGGEGTWDPIPAKEVDETLLCRAANGDIVRVKKTIALVGGPPPLRASDGLATCWAYHSQGGVQFKLRPQVGPLSLLGGEPGTSTRVRQGDPSEATIGGAQGTIG